MADRIIVQHRAKDDTVVTDITAFCVKQGSSRLFRSRKRTPGGSFVIDDSIPVTITALDEVRLSIDNGTTVTPVFTGVFVPSNDERTDNVWKIEGYARLLRKRKADGVYTQKTRSQILRLLIDEYLPELTYTDESLPLTGDDELIDERFIGRIIADIFDTYAADLKKVWDIDTDRVLQLLSDVYTDTGYVIDDAKIIGKFSTHRDVNRWMTRAKVEGEVTQTVGQASYVGGSIADKTIILSSAAQSVEVKRIPAGSNEADVSSLRGAIQNSGDDETRIDYWYNPKSMQVVFTDNVTIGETDTILVKMTNSSQIVAEAINPTAYQKYGLVDAAPNVNRLIQDEAKAEEIAQALADKYGEPLEIHTFETVWNANILPGGKVTLLSVKEGINALVDVTELEIVWNEKGVAFNLSLNSMNYDSIDAFENLQNRVRQLEERNRGHENFVRKTVLWFANIAIEIYSVRIENYDPGNSFRFDDSSGTSNFDNAARYLDGNNGGGSLIFVGDEAVLCEDDVIKFFFNDADVWDDSESSSTLDVNLCTVTF